MIYVSRRNLTLSDNQLLRGVEFLHSFLPRGKKDSVSAVFLSSPISERKTFYPFEINSFVFSWSGMARTRRKLRRPKSWKRWKMLQFVYYEFIFIKNVKQSQFLSRRLKNENEKLKSWSASYKSNNFNFSCCECFRSSSFLISLRVSKFNVWKTTRNRKATIIHKAKMKKKNAKRKCLCSERRIKS